MPLPDDADPVAAVAALELVAVGLLRELARQRGKGPWFGGLLNRIQSEALRLHPPKGATQEVKEAWDRTVHPVVYGVFSTVLGDKSVPDFRHDAAISASGAPNPVLAPAVAAGYRALALVLAAEVRQGGSGQERLRLLAGEAIGQAEVQTVPGDANGVLKDRWVGAAVAAIDSIVG